LSSYELFSWSSPTACRLHRGSGAPTADDARDLDDHTSNGHAVGTAPRLGAPHQRAHASHPCDVSWDVPRRRRGQPFYGPIARVPTKIAATLRGPIPKSMLAAQLPVARRSMRRSLVPPGVAASHIWAWPLCLSASNRSARMRSVIPWYARS